MRDADDREEAQWAAFDAALRSVRRTGPEAGLRERCLPAAQPAMKSWQVLVVDDEPNIRRLILHHLSTGPYQVRLASDGEEALAQLELERPDLVILDVMMPRVNGLDVLERIKSDPTLVEIPVILLTARDADDQIRRGWQQGTDLYLPKPFDPLALRLVVDRMTAVLGTPENPPPLRRDAK